MARIRRIRTPDEIAKILLTLASPVIMLFALEVNILKALRIAKELNIYARDHPKKEPRTEYMTPMDCVHCPADCDYKFKCEGTGKDDSEPEGKDLTYDPWSEDQSDE
jgi:hypothetical protein